MILAIDRGNTRLKAGLFEAGKLLETWTFGGEDPYSALRIALGSTPSRIKYIGLASVGNEATLQVKRSLSAFMETVQWVEINAAMPLPFAMAYRTPQTLGPDRLAAVAGALSLGAAAPLVAITAGTAITCNLLNSSNEFAGGTISPGIRMRLRALHEFTARLPLVEPAAETPLTGFDTETSLRSGAVNGAAAELNGLLDNWRQQEGNTLSVALTGGDAPFLAKPLKNVTFVDENLQLKGIHHLLSFNLLHG